MQKIFTIIPYSFFPPVNGGHLRCFYILNEMAKENEVYLFTEQGEEDFVKGNIPAFPPNVTIISLKNQQGYKSLFNIFPARIANALNFRFLKRKLFVTSNLFFLKSYSLLVQTLKKESFSVVYYENLESLSLFSDIVDQYLPSASQLYDAHNIDSLLWKQLAIAEENILFNEYASTALKAESSLHKKTNGVFCCSKEDESKLLQINKQPVATWVIPNGVDTSLKVFDNNPNKIGFQEILFCGSLDYYPNEEALIWFYNNVFALLKKLNPQIKFTIIGRVKDIKKYQFLMNDASINFVGTVYDVKDYYFNSSICIVPLKSGSGTRLKILEAMSFGNPVVSTSIGAEGIDYIDNENILIADDPVLFAESINTLLSDSNKFAQVQLAAKKLVDNTYDWKIIGKQINNALKSL